MRRSEALNNIRKESRKAILYARVRPSSLAWVHGQMKKLGHKSKSEFIDKCLLLLQDLMGNTGHKKAACDSNKKAVSGNRRKAKKAGTIRARHGDHRAKKH